MSTPSTVRSAMLITLSAIALAAGCAEQPATKPATPTPGTAATAASTTAPAAALPTTEAGWKERLTPEQFAVLRTKDTERPFTGAFWDNHQAGTYRCAGCGEVLFASADKFESGTGWPSFTRPADGGAVSVAQDDSHGMQRDEVLCHRCQGHLGHVFNDGPAPTGKRYCINSVSMTFEKAADKPAQKPAPEGARDTTTPAQPAAPAPVADPAVPAAK